MLANQHQLEEQIDSLKDAMDKNQLKQTIIHRKLQTLTNLYIQQNKQEHQYDTLFLNKIYYVFFFLLKIFIK
jgi:hypothetical protein